jgi:hypothetical protein
MLIMCTEIACQVPAPFTYRLSAVASDWATASASCKVPVPTLAALRRAV